MRAVIAGYDVSREQTPRQSYEVPLAGAVIEQMSLSQYALARIVRVGISRSRMGHPDGRLLSTDANVKCEKVRCKATNGCVVSAYTLPTC
jgi:hypothetical protein